MATKRKREEDGMLEAERERERRAKSSLSLSLSISFSAIKPYKMPALAASTTAAKGTAGLLSASLSLSLSLLF
jgi:hypothetical protein